MTGFLVNNFGGVIPRIGDRLLPHNAATTAENVKLFSGELKSWKRPYEIATPTTSGMIQSIYRLHTTTSTDWLGWTDDVDVAKSPIAGDTANKIYYTGDTTTATNAAAGPRKTNYVLSTSGTSGAPSDWLEMGVPAPGAAPVITVGGGTSTTTVARAYVYTYVTTTASWAEEGPPSLVGWGTGVTDGTWTVAQLSTGTTGKYAFAGGIKRIYRTLTDSAGNTNYQLALNNVPMATTSTGDTTADADLGVICPSFTNGVVNSEWVAPPSDLKGIIAMPNGFMVGFSGNQLCFSEPFYPHAWPIRYRLTTSYDIVGIGHYGQTIIVVTEGFPYAVSGSRPDSMSMSLIEEMHPCVSKRSIVSFSFGVMWATPDGLALAGPGGAINATEQFMKRDEWRALCFPDTIIGHQFQNVYFGFFNDGTVNRNFVFDKDNSQGPLTFGNFGAQGVWHDPETSKLYMAHNGAIYEWDADPYNMMPFDWWSKTFVLPRPVNFGAIQVEADYESLDDSANQTAQAAVDVVKNQLIFGTSTAISADTNKFSAWIGTSSYGTSVGTGTAAAIVRSSDGNFLSICTKMGTSTTGAEPSWVATIGGTTTDGTVEWKRIQEVTGVTKGSVRGHLLRNYIQYTTADPIADGTAGNQWGFPLRDGLELAIPAVVITTGTRTSQITYTPPSYDNRNLLLQVYAISTSSNSAITLVHTANLTNRNAIRLPRGFESDTWEVRISGNIVTRYFKIAETGRELKTI